MSCPRLERAIYELLCEYNGLTECSMEEVPYHRLPPAMRLALTGIVRDIQEILSQPAAA